ncbi:unnamed protein product [Schistosoma margrebowiei]|uniref:Uncharacterized protein n=1 Tax=Schistosoma margrebowiei TaxID=48269 RepID=A0A183MAK5_9TREM|nr:unnamed protein product [Schistosoma margrebowiei]
MEDNWKRIKEALNSSYREVLGRNKHHHEEWISIDILDRNRGRKNNKTGINNSRTRAEKFKAQAEYTEATKQIMRSNKAEKQKSVKEIATTVEKSTREGNKRQLYETTNKLADKYSKLERPVKDKEGRPITEIQEKWNRCVEYFKELFNRPAPMNPPDIEATRTGLSIDVSPPTTEEI